MTENNTPGLAGQPAKLDERNDRRKTFLLFVVHGVQCACAKVKQLHRIYLLEDKARDHVRTVGFCSVNGDESAHTLRTAQASQVV